MMKDEELILYGNSPYAGLLHELCVLGGSEGEEAAALAPGFLGRLLDMAYETGFDGNLWNDFLTRVLVSSENAYSLASELQEAPTGTIRAFALHDMEIFRGLFAIDPGELAIRYGVPSLALLRDFHADRSAGQVYSRRVRDRICSLAVVLKHCADGEEMLSVLTDFYNHFGVGNLGLHKAFRLRAEGDRLQIVPITRIAEVHFDDLVGYERAKELLIANTEAFLAGAPANNCLLYGDAGTGKSSSVKALANTYFERGLRIIEIYRHEFRYLNELIGMLKHRNYRFIIYMDDLSFEEFETEYKYLKAIIEGGLERKPDNILMIATSNRRHLIRESFRDKARLSDDDVHRSDTVQEKLSLFDRFGVTIYFGAPSPEEYRTIVRTLAARAGIDMPEEELLEEANRWELKHASYSGRVARQLIDNILGVRSLRSEGGTPGHGSAG